MILAQLALGGLLVSFLAMVYVYFTSPYHLGRALGALKRGELDEEEEPVFEL